MSTIHYIIGKFPIVSAFMALGLLLCSGCGEDKKPQSPQEHLTGNTPADILARFTGKKVATVQGTIIPELLDKQQPGLVHTLLPDPHSCVLALRHGKVEAYVDDEPIIRRWNARYANELQMLGPIIRENYAFGVPHTSPYIDRINETIRDLRANKELERFKKKWCDTAEPENKFVKWTHKKDYDGKGGKFRVGFDPTQEPMAYIANSAFTGYALEVAKRIAYDLNMEAELIPMNFDSLIAAAESGKIDLICNSMSITPERRRKITFTEAVYNGGLAVLTRRPAGKSAVPGAPINSLADLVGRRLAVMNGSCDMEVTEKLQPGINFKIMPDEQSCALEVIAGKVDAFVTDEPQARLWQLRRPKELRQTGEPYHKANKAYGLRKNSPLRQPVNDIIRKLKASGELARFKDKWCNSIAPDRKIQQWTHKKDFDGAAGELRVGFDPTLEPIAFKNASGYVGYDLEVANRIAYELNRKIVFVPLNFSGIIEALSAGKIDIICTGLSITPERQRAIDFSDITNVCGLSLVTRAAAPQLPRPTDVPNNNPHSPIKTIADMRGKKLGILTGSCNREHTEQVQKGINYVYFQDNTSIITALRCGKIDGIAFNNSVGRMWCARYPQDLQIAEVYAEDRTAIGVPKGSPLLEKTNRIIRQLHDSGELQKFFHAWCDKADVSQQSLTQWKHKKDWDGSAGVLRVGLDPIMEPSVFVTTQGYGGYDVETINRIAYELNMQLKIVPMNFGALVESVNSGKVDMIIGNLSITKERLEKIAFSQPTCWEGLSLIIRRPGAKLLSANGDSLGFLDELSASFERTFIKEGRGWLVINGLKVTIRIAVCAALFGTILAFMVWFLRTNRNRFLNALGRTYIVLLQGTPMLVFLMILYYLVFANWDISAEIVAVIGFGMNFAAYVGEMLRAGIDSVPLGQREAALALGFTPFQSFRKVILPQALKQILPVYRGEFIAMLKETSIVGYISIQDLTKISDIIRARTYEAFFPLIATALIYFIAAWTLAYIIRYIEHRIDPRVRRLSKGARS